MRALVPHERRREQPSHHFISETSLNTSAAQGFAAFSIRHVSQSKQPRDSSRSLAAAAAITPGAVAASGVRSHRVLFQNQLTDQLTADVLAQLLPIHGRGSRLGQ